MYVLDSYQRNGTYGYNKIMYFIPYLKKLFRKVLK